MRAAFRSLACLVLLLALSACIAPTSYVDPLLPAASAADARPAKAPGPVQLLVEFRTKGAANMAATNQVRPRMLDVARQSGLFSEVRDTPAANGRRLVVTIDNVGEADAGRAFLTGFTLGAVGTQAIDRYVCEARYEAPGRAPVALSYNHSMMSTIGATAGPKGLTGYPPATAVNMILDQLAWSIMRDIAASGAAEP